MNTKSGYIGNAVLFNKKYAIENSTDCCVSISTKEKYIRDNQHNTVEYKLVKLLSYLDGIKLARICEIGSTLDCKEKVDILVEKANDTILGFQVKYGNKNALAHTQKSDVGVFWIEDNYNPLMSLLHLSRFLELDIKPDVLVTLRLCKVYRGKLLPMKVVNLTPRQLEILSTLQLVQVRGRNIQF